MIRRVWMLAVALVIAAPGVRGQEDAPKTPELFKNLKYRLVGPGAGGRVARACGVPGDPLTYYAAASAGGVWKSTDGGVNWKPIFDEQPTHSIGAIAVAASEPSVIYVGSGEANVRGNVALGNGIYKSEDAGKTWKHVWKNPGQIGTIIVHPRDANIAYASVLGSPFGPGEGRGMYRTTDGGKSWKRVLFQDKDTGASDVCMDPSAPKVLFAGLWHVRRKPWELISGGPGSGLFTSRDGGDTWTRLVAESAPEGPGVKRAKGLPEGVLGKICVAIAPSDPRRVYAMIEADKGGLFRSDDGGETWDHVNDGRALRQRAWYFSHVTVHPTNPDIVWCPQVPLLRSIDGGKTFRRIKGPHHGDHHDIWIDPLNPKRIIDSNDGGVDISTDGGESWFAPPLPIAQFYRIEVDNHVPYRVMGTMQDIGTGRGPSNSLLSGGIRLSDWEPVGGGEAGHIAPDPKDSNVVYAGEYGGTITRHDTRTKQIRNISIYPFNPSGHDPKDLKYRFQWTAPILVSPHDSKVVYHAANVLFRTEDSGLSWKTVSPDLTRNDKTKQEWSGGPITGDNTGVEIYGTIFALAESPLKKGMVWVGTDDGRVHVQRESGAKWEEVTPKGLPEWATVQCVEPSPFKAEAAFVVAHNYRLDDLKPYLFRTDDGGKTWENMTKTLAKDVHLHCVRYDRTLEGLLYIGTEQGVCYSSDNGTTWLPLKLNLPTVAVNDLKVKGNDLVVGTNGRSIWILDDLTPVRKLASGKVAEELALLPALPAIRWRQAERMDDNFPFKGHDNPPEGVVFHYYLKEKPKGEIRVEILNEAGEKIRTLTSKEEPEEKMGQDEGSYSDSKYKPPPLPITPGLHRHVWDLKHDGARTIPRAILDSGQPKEGPLVTAGEYKLRLIVDGRVLTEKVEVRMEPRVTLAAATLREQERYALKLRDEISALGDVVTRLRSVRQQLQDGMKLFADDAKLKPLLEQGKQLTVKLDALEEKLHNPKAKAVYDILAQRGGAKLYSQLAWLLEQVKDSDGPVVQGVREVHAEQAELFKTLEKEWDKLLSEDVAAWNDQAKKLNVPGIHVPGRMPVKPDRN